MPQFDPAPPLTGLTRKTRSLLRRSAEAVVGNAVTWSLLNASLGRCWRRLTVDHERYLRSCVLDEDLAVAALSPGLDVRNGPFRGMRYPTRRALGSMLYPKLLGSYERELEHIVERASRTDYSSVVNIGCAEGYYAVGFALRLPKAVVFAFDTDPDARVACGSMAALNGVSHRVRIEGFCDPAALVSLPLGRRALIVSDCEGFERQLFTAKTVGELRQHDLLIETHDFLDLEVTPALRAAIQPTHDVTVIPALDDFSKLDLYDYPELSGFDRKQRRILVGEYRTPMNWWLASARR